jgi:glycosyltransferase involved in cell wall biosynthesis
VSIGLPVFDGERYLEGSIRSILAQTYTDFELLISDNASTDGTREICESFSALDGRIRYMRNSRNVGAAENYNRVFRASSGRYFKWASHDDLCGSEFVERCVSVMEGDPSVVLCYPRTMFIDEDGRSIGVYEESDDFTSSRASERFSTWLFHRSGPWCNAVFGVIRSDVLWRTPLIGKYNSSDVILLGELLLRGRMVRIPEVLFYRRDHPGRSVRAHTSPEARATWFDPAGAKKVQLPAWRWGRGYAAAVLRAPNPAPEKARCATLLARWFVMQRGRLLDELLGAFR